MKAGIIGLVVLFCAGLSAETEPSQIVENFCAASRDQAQSLEGSTMDVDIDASLPKLKKHGRLHGLRRISTLGKITYEHVVFEGDNTVKNQVIARYLTAEVEAERSPSPDVAVTPANYKFNFKGKAMADGRATYVFGVTPKKKRPLLFRGEVWIDAETYLPVLETGDWVKSPSVWVGKVAFRRKFEIRDGKAVPLQVASTVDTRIWGQAQLEIDFSNFSADAPALSGSGLDDSQ